ncbi:MAG TPA: VWA domain-containing protein [Candidatus Acidoferrales bacterium]|nr:VWA domain-containing protein [Candidatus Acidoferrales bacterium]
MRNRVRRRVREINAGDAATPVLFIPLCVCLALVCASVSASQSKKTARLPRRLDQGVRWHRDPVTGELSVNSESAAPGVAPTGPAMMRTRTQVVSVTCIVSTADGTAVPGLRKEDFRIFDDGAERTISYFDASTQPASVALVIDASPSVLRDSEEMKQAADALIGALAPLDQAAVVDFSAHSYLQLGFSDVREQIRRAVARVDPRELLADTGGSNIYEAVYLAARELFPGRTGRKAILLLTDGQDSGLGLTLDPASEVTGPGRPADRLTFDDVARFLAEQDIQVFAVSTENRPKVMTRDWLAAHGSATLINTSARRSGIPPYTLYLAELVRRAGGQLYFLRETETMADTFRKIAEKIRAEYTLGFAPVESTSSNGASAGWHSLRVEVADQPGARVSHRAAYYVPPEP